MLPFFLRVNVAERRNSFLLHHGGGCGVPPHNLLVYRRRWADTRVTVRRIVPPPPSHAFLFTAALQRRKIRSVLQDRAAGKQYLERRIRVHARVANVLIDKLWWSQPFDPLVSQLTITSHGKQKPSYYIKNPSLEAHDTSSLDVLAQVIVVDMRL